MALTQVKTLGIADDAVTEAKVANDAIGLVELKAGTDGQIITYDASGNPVAVGPGTDGQVLTSTGAGSPPAFEDTAGGGGKILQVVQEHRTDTWSESSIAPGDKTGAALTKAITTAANNNKVLVTISLTVGWNDQVKRTGCLLKRGGTEIALSDSTGDNITRLLSCMELNSGHWCEPLAFTYLDSPGSAASHSYTVHLWNGHESDTLTAYLNRTGYETNHSYRSRGTSSITLMEVSA